MSGERNRPRPPVAAAGKRREAAASGPDSPPAAPLPLSHPAAIAALALVAGAIAWSVTFHLPDTDSWQHLLVGKAIWQLRRVPTIQMWTWPTYGAPDVNPSWGFRALIWPFWKLGGIVGLFVWRWSSTLAAFALAWLASRRMGARGLGPLAAIAACAVLYRLRVQLRPETLAGVLLALEMWILETRRHGGPDRTPWLLAVALIWANCHVSYFLFFLVLGAHALDEVLRPDPPERRLRLILLGAVALPVMLINPWGWRALAQPFAYFFEWRHEAIYATIGELGRPRWGEEVWNGAAVIGFAVPALFLWRARRRGLDRIQLVLLLVTGAMALSSMRFLGFFALTAAPYLARDLDAWLMSRHWPSWTSRPWVRFAGVAVVALGVGLPSWTLPGAQMGVGLDESEAPVAACDFIARNGIHGRSFNTFEFGGYLLWRFWPERDRLPYMDIHQTGTPEDRRSYPEVHQDLGAWAALDRKHHFEWILLRHHELPGDALLDGLGADPRWALVFLDDVAALYVLRAGMPVSLAPFAYEQVRAGHEGMRALGVACRSDAGRRSRARSELERMARESRENAGAHAFLSLIAELDGRVDDALSQQREALAVDPFLPGGVERLGDLAMAAGRPREALEAWERVANQQPRPRLLDLRMGLAWSRLGDRKRAAEAFGRELSIDPGNEEARERLRQVEPGAP